MERDFPLQVRRGLWAGSEEEAGPRGGGANPETGEDEWGSGREVGG